MISISLSLDYFFKHLEHIRVLIHVKARFKVAMLLLEILE